LPHKALAAKRAKPGLGKFAPLRSGSRLQYFPLCPATAQATIVLPAFGQSYPNDGDEEKASCMNLAFLLITDH